MHNLGPSSDPFRNLPSNFLEHVNHAKSSSARGDSGSTKFWVDLVKDNAKKEGILLSPTQVNELDNIYKISIRNELPRLLTKVKDSADEGDVSACDLWSDSLIRGYKNLSIQVPTDVQITLRNSYQTARVNGINNDLLKGAECAQRGDIGMAQLYLDTINRYSTQISVDLTQEQKDKIAKLTNLVNANKISKSTAINKSDLSKLLSTLLSDNNSINFAINPLKKYVTEDFDDHIKNESKSFGHTAPDLIQNLDPKKIIEDLSILGKVGTDSDIELLRMALECFNPQILKHLSDAGYKISIARNNIADATDNIRGRKVGESGVINDYAGINLIREDSKQILIKSSYEDGNLKIDFAALANEIGHALWITDYFKPAAKQRTIESVHQQEKHGFDNQQLQEFDQYKAATFVLYLISPDKLKSQFPKTYDFYAQQNIALPIIDSAKALNLFRVMNPTSDLTLDSDIQNLFIRSVKISDTRQNETGEGESLVIFLAGEKKATKLVAKQLGDELIIQRTGAPPFTADEGFIHVTKESTADLEKFFNLLKSSRGSVLYVDDTTTFSPDSAFMQEFTNFCKNHNGWCHIVISCSTHEFGEFGSFLPENPRMSSKVEELSPDQIIKQLQKFAVSDGMIFTTEASEALVPFIKRPLTIDESFKLWVDIKDAHTTRIVNDNSSSNFDEAEFRQYITNVTSVDINETVISKLTSPIDRLDQMIGLKNVKEKIHELIAGVKLNKYLKDAGQPTGEQRRLNFVWPGNPGTGKTTVARLASEIFYAEEIIERNNFIEISAPELIEKGASYAIQKFKQNQGGIIFIDEFHQLDPSNNPKGKEIIDLLIPMLTAKEWERTAFVFAGYKKKINNMMRADEGLFSRLEVVEFKDYTREELELIARKEMSSKQLTASEVVISALMDRVEKMQRSSPYPANARNVVKTVEQVVASQRSRLEKIIRQGQELSNQDVQTITEQDVLVELEVSAEEVLAEINQTISGNEKYKELMMLVYGLVQRNKQLGRDIGDDIPMAIAIDGQSGTGKTTMAWLAGKLYHALGLLPNSTLVETPGSQMVGGFVGNSSAIAVDEKFEEAYGGVLFIDEVSAMTAALEFSKQSIKQLITNMVDPDNKVLVVVADYQNEMDIFMGFDAGVAPRFKHRITAEVMSVEVSYQLFNKITSEKYTFEDGASQIVQDYLAKLVVKSQFASGRDINTLADYLAAAQVRAFQDLVGSNLASEISKFNWKLITNQMLQDAFTELLNQVDKRPTRSTSFVPRGVPISFNHDRKTNQEIEYKDTSKELLTKDENNTRLAIVKVNESYADLANNKPDEFKKLIEDPNSEYYVKIGNELNTSSEDAYSKIKQLEKKLSTILDERDPKKELKFDYDCPFCGGVNSSKCHYFSNSQPVKPDGFLYSTEWLVMHSRRPPYYIESEKSAR